MIRRKNWAMDVIPDTLSYDELSRLLAASDDESPAGVRDRALLEFMYETGCRVSEACNLELDNLHAAAGEGRWALVVNGKGDRTRDVYFGESAAHWLLRYLRVRHLISEKHATSPKVFISKKSGRLDRSTAWKHIKACAVKARINPSRVSPHVLRHSIATHWLENGMGIPVIQQLLGHARLSTTQIYTRVGIRELQDEYNKYHPLA